MPKQLTAIGVLVVVALVGCGPSNKQEASLNEIRTVQAAFGDLQKAVNASMSKQDFSEKTESTLVKIGDLQRSEMLAESGFPAEKKNQVAEIYVQFAHTAQLYSVSQPFVGPDVMTDSVYGVDMLNNSEQETIRNLPLLYPELVKSEGINFRTRSEALQGLWKLAGASIQASDNLIHKLSTPGS